MNSRVSFDTKIVISVRDKSYVFHEKGSQLIAGELSASLKGQMERLVVMAVSRLCTSSSLAQNVSLTARKSAVTTVSSMSELVHCECCGNDKNFKLI